MLAALLCLPVASLAEDARPDGTAAEPPAATGTQASQEPVAPPPQRQGWLEFEVGTFWRLTAPNGARSHLFGTLHIGSESELRVPGQLWTALRAARRVVVEVALDELDPAEAQRLWLLPRHEAWDLRWTQADLAALRKRLVSAGQHFEPLGRVRPWVLVNTLSLGNAVPAQSIDDLIIARARASKIDVLPLETMQQQFAAFDCAATVEHLLVLQDVLATTPADFNSLMQDAMRLYAEQRVGAMASLMEARFPRAPAAREVDARVSRCVIDDRNDRFLVGLDPLLLQPGTLVAVGAAHLVGPRGLLAQLRDRGFAVERVPPSDVEIAE